MFTIFNAFMRGYLSRSISLIQPAEKSDLSTLGEIHAASFSHAWSDGELEKMFSNENYLCLVAHPPKASKSKPSGFVLVRSVLEEAEIITIATKPSARRKGIARQLMQATIRNLEFDRKTKLFLEVDEANHAAIKLYKSLGFIKVGEREGYYSNTSSQSGKKSTALVMQLELG